MEFTSQKASKCIPQIEIFYMFLFIDIRVSKCPSQPLLSPVQVRVGSPIQGNPPKLDSWEVRPNPSTKKPQIETPRESYRHATPGEMFTVSFSSL